MSKKKVTSLVWFRNNLRVLDNISLTKSIEINKNSTLEITSSVTNAYNRENIFYFNRIEHDRVNQLPMLPSAGVSLTF